ncbi:hypothetical protein [Corallibacter sp.]|uniref:hypothetical protein n=1 Tax=Corallibacter sp. TaxID=2038084 RepID=UPI003AB88C0D
MKKLKESDLQIGDILIFEDFHFNPLTFLEKCRDGKKEAFYYLLHYLIAWFDPGKKVKIIGIFIMLVYGEM